MVPDGQSVLGESSAREGVGLGDVVHSVEPCDVFYTDVRVLRSVKGRVTMATVNPGPLIAQRGIIRAQGIRAYLKRIVVR